MKLSSCAIAAVFVAGAFAAPAKPVSRLEDRSLETVSHVKNPTPPDPFKGTPARSVPNEESGLVERDPRDPQPGEEGAPIQEPRPVPGEDGSGFKPAGGKPRAVEIETDKRDVDATSLAERTPVEFNEDHGEIIDPGFRVRERDVDAGLVERVPAKVNQDAAPVQHPRPIPGEDGSGFKPAGSKPRDIRNKTKAPIFTGDPAIKRAPKDVKNKTKVPIFTGDPAFTG
ncbi:hypothetical protein CPLU01_02533 [Colletotrichum plurivorum]|uniref:Uncharacterized protein n=1 Tax=Colletotrichum plurivorum TaxID=2175906 RepID=A0A8H6KWW8_9PEZI|nr:hypothetical protein CPLU01_02533 [Colletotrichum plurivorum]